MSSPTDLPEIKSVLAIKRRGLTLALLTMAYFFSYMDRSILAILQEAIIRDLRVSDFAMGIISGTAFAIFYAGLGLPVARLADRTNRVRIISIALAIWSGFTALGGLATNFWQLLGARIGVGIGEAGSSPPSHSIIADLYPPEKRTSAMAIYSLGVGLGAAMGTVLGGTVLHFYGWRAALYVVGLPGLLLAIVIWAFVPEPKRGLSDAQLAVQSDSQPGFLECVRALLANRAALHLIMGFTLTSMIGYGHAAFGPSYLQRSFGFGPLDIAWKVAPAAALVILAGTIGSGKLADWLARRRGIHAQATMVAVFKACALPFMVLFYATSSTTVAVSCYMAALFFGSCYLGPTFSLIQGEAPLRQRAMWSAIALLVNNLIGLGLGPALVGGVSTLLKPVYGAESLRYAMFIFAAITPWAIFHYWRAGVMLKRARAAD
ncbi:MAG: transporter [Sphingomonas bacterium]|nr:transporter [Sphingomonas bacterium]